ncbi:hypothetical protein EML15_08140 [Corynebacterium sp. sy017]|uniref:hypothetical protein n=1 Tax=unclassified Corynebacterium TaxID=2624378 RepID=UPI001184F1C9|nr:MULTISPECIES: hypothetical protein [unclassified Corynebacterium]MBP3089113.1 hypothetical protein [Corynebacterium sp. sy017]QDZ42472.1 hypothetical protein FQV43_04310 [Corynebacterium sp. sy039]TSD91427.1 hypothetical protein ELY17_08150 [Corynebacterium sp. SY003]
MSNTANTVTSDVAKPVQQQARGRMVPANPSFGSAMKAEFTKLFTMRSTLVWIILFLGCQIGISVLNVFFHQINDIPASIVTWSDAAQGTWIAQILAVILGGGASAEISHRMTAHSFLTQNNRSNWLWARFIVQWLFVFVLNAVAVFGSFLVLITDLSGPFVFDSAWQPILVSVLGVPFYTTIATGLGVTLRNRVATIGSLLVVFLVIEPMLIMSEKLSPILEWMRKLSAGTVLTNMGQWYDSMWNGTFNTVEQGRELGYVTPGLSILVLAGWVIVFVVAGLWSNKAHDVR